jgi:hypothetical protein
MMFVMPKHVAEFGCMLQGNFLVMQMCFFVVFNVFLQHMRICCIPRNCLMHVHISMLWQTIMIYKGPREDFLQSWWRPGLVVRKSHRSGIIKPICLVPTNYLFLLMCPWYDSNHLGGCRDVNHNMARHTRPHHLAQRAIPLVTVILKLQANGVTIQAHGAGGVLFMTWQYIERPPRLGPGLLPGIWHIDATPTMSVVPLLRLMVDSNRSHQDPHSLEP